MAKTVLTVLSENPPAMRIDCACGEYYHKLTADDAGNPVLDSFVKGSEPAPPTKTKARGKGIMAGFFDPADDTPDENDERDEKGGK